MHVSNLVIKFLDKYGCLKKSQVYKNSSKMSPTHTDGIISLHFADFSIWIRVGKTGSLGPWSSVIVYCSKLSFCQNDPPWDLKYGISKTWSLGPWSRVIVYCSKLSFCQNDRPMGNIANGRIILAKGKLATIHYDSAPRPQRSRFAHPSVHT